MEKAWNPALQDGKMMSLNFNQIYIQFFSHPPPPAQWLRSGHQQKIQKIQSLFWSSAKATAESSMQNRA
jgi:hypothetical protein